MLLCAELTCTFCLYLQSVPLHVAAENNRAEVVDVLLSHNALVYLLNAISSLHYDVRSSTKWTDVPKFKAMFVYFTKTPWV